MIKVAIIGVGNCACSLLQVIEADRKEELTTGVMSREIAKRH